MIAKIPGSLALSITLISAATAAAALIIYHYATRPGAGADKGG